MLAMSWLLSAQNGGNADIETEVACGKLHLTGLTSWRSLPLLDLSVPALYAVAFATDLDIQLDVGHAFCIIHKFVIAHATSVRSCGRQKFEHGGEEAGDFLSIFYRKVVLLFQYVCQCPVAQPVNVPQFSFPVEDFLRPLPRQA